MSKISFTYDDKKLRNNVRQVPKRVDNIITHIVEYHSVMGTTYMKSNAPWTDRTGAARNGLFTIVEHVEGQKQWAIVFAHSVTYGIWLEIAHNGRYQIIIPSVRYVGQSIMVNLQHTLDRMKNV